MVGVVGEIWKDHMVGAEDLPYHKVQLKDDGSEQTLRPLGMPTEPDSHI